MSSISHPTSSFVRRVVGVVLAVGIATAASFSAASAFGHHDRATGWIFTSTALLSAMTAGLRWGMAGRDSSSRTDREIGG